MGSSEEAQTGPRAARVSLPQATPRHLPHLERLLPCLSHTGAPEMARRCRALSAPLDPPAGQPRRSPASAPDELSRATPRCLTRPADLKRGTPRSPGACSLELANRRPRSITRHADPPAAISPCALSPTPRRRSRDRCLRAALQAPGANCGWTRNILLLTELLACGTC